MLKMRVNFVITAEATLASVLDRKGMGAIVGIRVDYPFGESGKSC